eukprot:TRINITY_DN2899_c0_g1_i1.p1 TRINITY_DN2899_c0_g1~~TRINITY_DN2899_c0_g1_i1.p1  ORF type:complete len:430 (+),score=163.96 TRINITY_DN2899_c0_g1_i1:362-1651(+)
MFLSQPKFKSSRAPRKNVLKIDVGLLNTADPQQQQHQNGPSSSTGLAPIQTQPCNPPQSVEPQKKKFSLRVSAPVSPSSFPTPLSNSNSNSISINTSSPSSSSSSLSRSGGPFSLGFPSPAVSSYQPLLSRREQIAMFRGVCSEIMPSIFMGDEMVSSNYQQLKERGITHILNCAGSSIPNSFPQEFCYESIELLDCPTEDISGLFYTAISFIDEAVNLSNGKVLVHCKCGISRSSALVLCYIMYTNRIDYSTALSLLKKSRSVCEPNAGYALSLMNWFSMLQESMSSSPRSSSSPSSSPPSSSSILSSSPGSTSFLSSRPKVQVYKIEAMSAQNPLLTPKLLCTPFDASTITRFDCALIKTRSMLYIWVGGNCSEFAIDCAQRFAQLLQRYEDASGTIKLTQQPHEIEKIFQLSPSSSPTFARHPPLF